MRIELNTKECNIVLEVDDNAFLTLPDLLQYIDQCIKGLGYQSKGELEYVFPEYTGGPIEPDNTELD